MKLKDVETNLFCIMAITDVPAAGMSRRSEFLGADSPTSTQIPPTILATFVLCQGAFQQLQCESEVSTCPCPVNVPLPAFALMWRLSALWFHRKTHAADNPSIIANTFV